MKQVLFPMLKQYWRTSGSLERGWSNLWRPGLKDGHFSQYKCVHAHPFQYIHYILAFDISTRGGIFIPFCFVSV